MKIFVDHNITAVAISALAGVTNAADFTDVQRTDNRCIETMRTVVDATAHHHQLVSSNYCLETLRRVLVRGGSDLEPIENESAIQSVAVIRELAAAGGCLPSVDTVQDMVLVAEDLADRNGALRQGHVDYEDCVVIASVLAAQCSEFDQSVIITHDTGLLHCARALERRSVAVISASAWLQCYARRAAA